MTPKRMAEAYLATWNATEPATREALLAEHWSRDARYVDPLMSGSGTDQLGGLIDAVQQRFPSYRFTLRGEPDGHGRYVRLAWSLGEPGREAPIEGSDVLALRDGRIEQVIGFIDRAPAG